MVNLVGERWKRSSWEGTPGTKEAPSTLTPVSRGGREISSWVKTEKDRGPRRFFNCLDEKRYRGRVSPGGEGRDLCLSRAGDAIRDVEKTRKEGGGKKGGTSKLAAPRPRGHCGIVGKSRKKRPRPWRHLLHEGGGKKPVLHETFKKKGRGGEGKDSGLWSLEKRS